MVVAFFHPFASPGPETGVGPSPAYVASPIDTIPPTATTMNVPTEWTRYSVTFKVYAHDEGGSGIHSITAPDGTVVAWDICTYTVSENGSYDLIIRDNAGNQTVFTVIIDSNIDTTPKRAIITPNDGAWRNHNTEVKIEIIN